MRTGSHKKIDTIVLENLEECLYTVEYCLQYRKINNSALGRDIELIPENSQQYILESAIWNPSCTRNPINGLSKTIRIYLNPM